MKHIIFVKEMKNESCVKTITEALEETRVDFEVSLPDRAVIVDGSNDMIHIAKTTIKEAGFDVE